MAEQDKAPERWSVRRWKQLEKLERLLQQCELLDGGNNITSRIKFLEKTAKELRFWELSSKHQSFMSFLKENARADYATRRRKKPAPKHD